MLNTESIGNIGIARAEAIRIKSAHRLTLFQLAVLKKQFHTSKLCLGVWSYTAADCQNKKQQEAYPVIGLLPPLVLVVATVVLPAIAQPSLIWIIESSTVVAGVFHCGC